MDTKFLPRRAVPDNSSSPCARITAISFEFTIPHRRRRGFLSPSSARRDRLLDLGPNARERPPTAHRRGRLPSRRVREVLCHRYARGGGRNTSKTSRCSRPASKLVRGDERSPTRSSCHTGSPRPHPLGTFRLRVFVNRNINRLARYCLPTSTAPAVGARPQRRCAYSTLSAARTAGLAAATAPVRPGVLNTHSRLPAIASTMALGASPDGSGVHSPPISTITSSIPSSPSRAILGTWRSCGLLTLWPRPHAVRGTGGWGNPFEGALVDEPAPAARMQPVRLRRDRTLAAALVRALNRAIRSRPNLL